MPYRVEYDTELEQFDVLDADGIVYDSFTTKDEADWEAQRLADSDEAAALIDAINENIDDLPLATLQAMAAARKGGAA